MSIARPPRRTFSRLNLEALEVREVPAAYFWNPCEESDLLSTTPGNWMMGTGVPYAYHTEAPNQDDDLYFQGGVTNAACTILNPPPPTTEHPYSFHGLHLIVGLNTVNPPVGEDPPPPPMYWGTVTLDDSFAVGTLTVMCGIVRQNDQDTVSQGDAGTLTVKTELQWTGGTLNNNTVAGKIELAPGATGVAAPTFDSVINGTVALGSTLSTDVGAEMTVNEGKYQVNCALGFSVLAGGHLALAAPVPKSIRPNGMIEVVQGGQRTNETENAEKGLVNVKQGGIATVRAAKGDEKGSSPMKVLFGGENPRLSNRGTTIIKEGITVEFRPSENATDKGGGLSQSANDGAVLSMEAGTGIVCKEKTNVTLHGGTLELVEAKNGNGVAYASQSQVFILAPDHAAGDFALDLKAVAGLDHANATVPIPLYIDGAFRAKGDITMYANQSTGLSDTIVVEKQIKFDPADLTVEWFVPGPCYNTNTWPLIRSLYSDSTGNTVAISSLPTYHLPPAAGGGLLSLSLDSNSTVINFACTTP